MYWSLYFCPGEPFCPFRAKGFVWIKTASDANAGEGFKACKRLRQWP